jgi:hypothetical protein
MALVAAPAFGQVFSAVKIVDSFEDPTGIANVTQQADPISLAISQSTIGATQGSRSMLAELSGGGSLFSGDSLTGWALQDTVTAANNPTGYAGWQTATANPDYWNFQFDITTTADSWTNAHSLAAQDGGTDWSYPRIGLGYDGGFAQITAGTNLYNYVGKTTVSIPLSQLTQAGVPIPTDSSFYNILIGAQNRFEPASPTTGAKWYIDKLRLRPASVTGAIQLFSWETPDNPATTTVNEAMEGWSDVGVNAPTATSPGDRYAHTDSVTTYSVLKPPGGGAGNAFPTAGTHSLKIDTTSQDPLYVNPLGLPQSYGFRWGTSMILNAGSPPEGQTAVEVQNKITNMANLINNAESIQFDVAFSDPVADENPDGRGIFQGGSTATLPGFLSVAVSIQDSRGTFFQQSNNTLSNGANIQAVILEQNPDGNSPDEPVTFTFPIANFLGAGGSASMYPSLLATPIPLDSTSLRINIALNFNNGPVIAHIDNFRVLTAIKLDADFNRHGQVNGTDLGVWRTAFNSTDLGDADEDGDSDGADILKWQQQLGNAALTATPPVGAVPEPSGVLLIALGLAGYARIARNRLIA